MSKPSIAYVVLTWNSQKHIIKCLQSISKCQSIDSYIFVVDNGSTDMTPDLLRSFKKELLNLNCTFLDKNYGTTISRNIVMRSLPSCCDYICVLDSDTAINQPAILSMITALKCHPDIGLIGPSMINTNGERQLSGRNLPTLGIKLRKATPIKSIKRKGAELEIPSTPIKNGLQDVPYLLSACWLMPISTINTVGLLDENIFYAPEDVEYCVRVHQHGLRVVKCWDAEIIHEYQRLSHKKLFSKTNVEHIKGLVYYFKKYGYMLNADKVFKRRL